MIIAGTGHRPPALGITYSTQDRDMLDEFVYNELEKFDNVDLVYSGMAQGFDQSLAIAAKNLRIPYIATLPFPNMDARWPEESRNRFASLLNSAEDIITLRDKFSNKAYFYRDMYMVDNCDLVLSLYNEENMESGTGITVAYAREQSKVVINLWDSWKLKRRN